MFTGAIYRSRVVRASTTKGETLVEFGGGGLQLANPNCFFSTSERELQEALEKHPLFNASDGFELHRSEGEDDSEAEKPETVKAVKEVKEVKTLDDAKKYILKNHKGYTQADVSTAEKVNELADKLGIRFHI
jgi:hypothetical protein